MKVLLVDDDFVDRKTIKRALRDNPDITLLHEVSSAIEGLKASESGSFDVLLLDYMMPEVDGIEMVVELRGRPNLGETAIIMMSTSDDEVLALSCLQAGAQDFIAKSEITTAKLKRFIIQAKKRFELEVKLHDSFCQVRDMAVKDALTGLANRYHFEETLKISLDNYNHSQGTIALLLLDLDHFKNVNDSYGHEAGDQLLKDVANRVSECLRGNEVFARFGGDEFAILISGLKVADDTTFIAQRIIKSLEAPFEIAGRKVQCGVSVGISLFPDNADSAEALVRYADIAMYRAKQLGRNQICYFENEMQEHFSRNYRIETQLKQAMKKQDFELHYQPVMNTDSKKIVGVEALIRWPNCTFKCTPDEFIPIAEQSGLIDEIGEWVMDSAIKQLSVWRQKFGDTLTMAVNVSAVQLSNKSIVAMVENTLKKYQVPAKLLVIELTETALLVQNEQNSKHIAQLSALGCKLALDDFGTGFSALSHLLNLPINTVKLDKSILPTSTDENRHLSIFKGIVAMFRSIGLHIIAEGVETQFQYDLCNQFKVDELQGYLFDKAQPALALEKKWLNEIETT